MMTVEMECRYDADARKAKVIVITPSEYHDHHVVFDSGMRVLGMKFRGVVYSAKIWSASRKHCILVNEQGFRDPMAYEIISAPRKK